MMKNLFKTCIMALMLVVAWGLSNQAQATHLAGADLTYQYLSTNLDGTINYRVNFTWIEECSSGSVSQGITQVVNATSTCGGSQSVTLNQTVINIITPVCNSNIGCGQTNPAIIVYEQRVYAGNITLRPCDTWTLSATSNARNNGITTGPSGSLFVQATLNNATYPTNSSPAFANLPITTICVNQPFAYNHGAADVDGNTLTYTFTQPRISATGFVTYNMGYSFTQPYIGTLNLNGATGALSGTPTQQDVTVMAVQVTERDAFGNVIGTIVRDIQIQIIPCNNTAPVVTPVTVNDTICIGDPYTLVINSTDADNDEVTMTYGGEIPSATFTIANNSSANPFPTGTFTWTPTAADFGPHTFTVQVRDTACPVNGLNVYTYQLYVDSCCEFDYVLSSCCEVEIESGDGSGNITSSGTVRADAIAYLEKETGVKRSSTVNRDDECDPCIDGGYPVWVESSAGGPPIDFNDSDPCITIEWLDDAGVVLYTGWSFWADTDEDYTVRVTNTCDGCVWEEDFTYTCCPDIPVVIQNCCEIGGAQALPAATKSYVDGIYADINKEKGTSYSRAASCDPCLHPEIPFVLIVGDGNHNPYSTPPYTISWTASNGDASSDNWILAWANVTYYVVVTDPDGCEYRDTFLVDCCPTPTRPICRVDRRGVPTMSWDAVPGATSYQVMVTTNDTRTRCCTRTTGFPQSILINIPAGTSFTPNVSYICASWSVRAVCPNGGFSDWTAPQCICSNRIIIISNPFELDGKRVGEDNGTIEAYPSPANTFLTVEGAQIAPGAVLRLVDISGRTMLSKTVEEAGSQRLETVSIPNGIYFLHVSGTETKVKAKKVVIIH